MGWIAVGQPGSTSGPVSALGLEGDVRWVCLASVTGLNPKPPESFFPDMQWAWSEMVGVFKWPAMRGSKAMHHLPDCAKEYFTSATDAAEADPKGRRATRLNQS